MDVRPTTTPASGGDVKMADPATYLGEVKAELEKEWPNNRIITIVCHGHSVPAGFFNPPQIDSLNAYPHLCPARTIPMHWGMPW